MTRKEFKRSKRVLEKERRAAAREQNEQKKISLKVSKNLIAAEGQTGLTDDGRSLVNARDVRVLRPRRIGFKYIRVSTEAQDGEDRVSLTEQSAAIDENCEINDIEIVEEFRDVAPGRTEDRTGFNRMLSEIRKRRVDFIVCWKGDRLARSVSAANLLLEALVGTDTELIAVQEREEISWAS